MPLSIFGRKRRSELRRACNDRSMRYNPPPNWPAPPSGWVPEPAWSPDPSWPAPPPGWQLWQPDVGDTIRHMSTADYSAARLDQPAAYAPSPAQPMAWSDHKFPVGVYILGAVFIVGCLIWVAVVLLKPDPVSFSGDGVKIVGTDIEPGRYHAEADGLMLCIWYRLSGPVRTEDNIIDTSLGVTAADVHIRSSDAAFETSGCGTWVKKGW